MEARLLTDKHRISTLEWLTPRLALLFVAAFSLVDFARMVPGVRQAYRRQRASKAQSKIRNDEDRVVCHLEVTAAISLATVSPWQVPPRHRCWVDTLGSARSHGQSDSWLSSGGIQWGTRLPSDEWFSQPSLRLCVAAVFQLRCITSLADVLHSLCYFFIQEGMSQASVRGRIKMSQNASFLWTLLAGLFTFSYSKQLLQTALDAFPCAFFYPLSRSPPSYPQTSSLSASSRYILHPWQPPTTAAEWLCQPHNTGACAEWILSWLLGSGCAGNAEYTTRRRFAWAPCVHASSQHSRIPVDHAPTQARIQIVLPCSSRGVSIHENWIWVSYSYFYNFI